jgi:hypothetical protein
MTGFEIDLAEAQAAVDQHFPVAAEHIRADTGVLREHESFGAGEASAKVQAAYAGVTHYLAGHLDRGARVAEGIGQALGDILELYRRADGRT